MSATGVTELHQYGERRDALLRRLVKTLRSMPSVRGAWLSGSFGRGEADEWSDLDLHVAVADDDADATLSAPRPMFAAGGDALLVQAGWPSDSFPGGRFWLVVYDGPFEVDWNIGPVSKALRPQASQLLFEREPLAVAPDPASPPAPTQLRSIAQGSVDFFWAMAPIACKYAGRGHTRAAASQVALLQDGFRRLWLAVHDPAMLGPDPFHQNRRLPVQLDATMPRLPVEITPVAALATIEALCRAVEVLHAALAGMGVVVPGAMPGQVRSMVDLATRVARVGGSSPEHGSRR